MVSQLTRERAVPSLQRYIKDNFAQTAKVSIKRYINTTKRNDQRKVSEIRKNWTFNFWISQFLSNGATIFIKVYWNLLEN